MVHYAVLLNSVMGTTFDESSLTKNMTVESRAKNLQRMLIGILNATARRDLDTGKVLPRVIVFEDLHWYHHHIDTISCMLVLVLMLFDIDDDDDDDRIDSGSWELAVEVCKVQSLLVILTTRPLGKIVHLSKILRYQYTHKSIALTSHHIIHKSLDTFLIMMLILIVPLNELGEKETLQLACSKLGVRRVPMVVQNIIRNKTQGHPLYIEELVRSLIEEKLVTIDAAGTCHAAPQLEKGNSHQPILKFLHLIYHSQHRYTIHLLNSLFSVADY
jgi:hypothetical protein